MKILLKLSVLWLLVIVSAGCAAQKPGSKAGKNSAQEVLYQQTLKALDEKKFIIKINECYFPSDKPPVSVTNSYVSMQGSHIVLHFSQDFPAFPATNRDDEYDNAEITNGKSMRNGNTEFYVKFGRGLPRLSYELAITVYKNTNNCFVHVVGGYNGANIINFKGHIYSTEGE